MAAVAAKGTRFGVPKITNSTLHRVVILGSGWAGFRLARSLNKSKFRVTMVSPRNHFLFTPLLPSTTVGTLEFRCVQEPVRTVPGLHYYQSRAVAVDFPRRTVHCTDHYLQHKRETHDFDLEYDSLVLAVGCKSGTFGVPGISSLEETRDSGGTGTGRHNVMFLKQLEHARSIRNRIIECFERASSPFYTTEERRRLLTFVVVGGGPTSIEFASELYDFLKCDVTKWYEDFAKDYRVVIVEAGGSILGSFDHSLRSYVEREFRRRRVEVLTNVSVAEVGPECVRLDSGEEIPFGLCVWSTGNVALDFVTGLNLRANPGGRVYVDDLLRVLEHPGVYGIGDCVVNEARPLGMLAQVANQQAKHLSFCLNKNKWTIPFRYKFLGSMAQLGTFDAVVDLPKPSNGGARPTKLTGFLAFLAWRTAYWTYSVSWTNKLLIPMFWFKSYWLGRDISKF